MTYSTWVGPVAGVFVSDLDTLVDQMWGKLLESQITGKEYARRGQPDSGKWGDAKALRDQIKAT